MKLLFDLFPVIVFFAAFKLADIYVATVGAMLATFAQIGWVWFRHRKVDNMLWVSLVLVTVFGGATLILHDETFIKWKPTILYWVFAIVLIGSERFARKNLIRAMLAEQLTLPERIWLRLNIAWAIFFTAMGFLNIAVASRFSTDTWVNFKLFGATGLLLIFMVIQGVMVAKYVEHSEDT